MKENVLDVLIYLFENYMFYDDEPDQEALIIELSQAGFEHPMIEHAFEWLENLALMCEDGESEKPIVALPSAIRVFTPLEQEIITMEGLSFIVSLEQTGVLDWRSREMVIDQILSLCVEEVDMEQVKWVILMVLSNYCDNEAVNEWTENLVLDGIHTALH
jgi:Smg protein